MAPLSSTVSQTSHTNNGPVPKEEKKNNYIFDDLFEQWENAKPHFLLTTLNLVIHVTDPKAPTFEDLSKATKFRNDQLEKMSTKELGKALEGELGRSEDFVGLSPMEVSNYRWGELCWMTLQEKRLGNSTSKQTKVTFIHRSYLHMWDISSSHTLPNLNKSLLSTDPSLQPFTDLNEAIKARRAQLDGMTNKQLPKVLKEEIGKVLESGRILRYGEKESKEILYRVWPKQKASTAWDVYVSSVKKRVKEEKKKKKRKQASLAKEGSGVERREVLLTRGDKGSGGEYHEAWLTTRQAGRCGM